MTTIAEEKSEMIIAAIRQVFGNVSLGNGISLHEADAIDDYANDEQRKKARALDTDQHWWEIPPEQLEQLSSGLFYMDAEGFRYYLPALMTHALKNYTVGSRAMGVVLTSLFPVTEGAADKFALLDNPQKKSVAQFLWFIATETDNRRINELEVYNATKALEDVWYPYLS